MPRPTYATLDLAALAHNHARVRSQAGRARIWSVVKANAYGHGLLRVAHTLAPLTDGFALVEFEGAAALREAGIQHPILMLEGCYDTSDLQRCAELSLTPVLHVVEQVQALLAANLARPLSVMVKLNTGMNRLGFAPAELPNILQQLQGHSAIASINLMTHFADADGPTGIATPLQRFKTLTDGLGLPVSLANSATILRYPEAQGDWVRPGIMLYGASPFPEISAAELDLKPVMSLHGQLLTVRELQPGDTVGYGCGFVAPEPMRIGVAACGYADGYPRHAPTGTPIVVDGVRTRTLGRVSMDKICVDLAPVPQAQVGSPVLFWGTDGKVTLPADEVAVAAGTIAYELFCALTARVPVKEIGMDAGMDAGKHGG
ncbi:MAG: alanine racemase [Rhodocyclaceae bacterium]|nr:alanine racemase [Rhodocyclaceae bacterium]